MFSIIERVVKGDMNINTTLENTYKITEICLAELKSQGDDLGDKLNSIKVKIQCLDIEPLAMKRKRKMPERSIDYRSILNIFINNIFIILYLDMKLQEMYIFQIVYKPI